MMRTLRSIFSIILIATSIYSSAQKQEWKGLTLGVDLSRFAIPLLDSTRYGWEISGDYEIRNNLCAVAELGWLKVNKKDLNYNYSAGGFYTRLGVDYIYVGENNSSNDGMMVVGLRYGFTRYNHQALNVRVRNEYFGDLTGVSFDKKWLNANWLELVGGMKTRLFNNFYLGWTARVRVMLQQQKDVRMQTFIVPGYGRGWNTSSLGINYSLYYKIPITKKKFDEKIK